MDNCVQPVTAREKLYSAAKDSLDIDASPRDVAPDDLACCESFSEIYRRAFGYYPDLVNNKPTLSTPELYKIFINNPLRFQQVATPTAGSIIICVTGTGNGNFFHGHIGVCGNFGIMSNDSNTGLWKEKYSYSGWNQYYSFYGGFPVHYFNPL